MLSDYWLLSDLDGTLISTPHKAAGHYLPLTRSPCNDPLRRWLLNGGNVCVVTTADQRVVQQLYLPLRATLTEAEARCGEYHARRERYRLAKRDGNSSSSNDRRKPKGGKLLMSLYTGAVLYLCTGTSVQLLPGYTNALHCATREAVELTTRFAVPLPMARLLTSGTANAGPGRSSEDNITGVGSGTGTGAAVPSSLSLSSSPTGSSTTTTALPPPPPPPQPQPNDLVACVRGTCINRGTSDRLQSRIKVIYEAYLRDILSGEAAVLAGLTGMSGRYKRVWRAILTYLDHAFHFHKNRRWAIKALPKGGDFSILHAGATAESAESREWKLDYFRRCDGFLAALGLLRVEYIESEVSYNDDDDDTTRARADKSNSSSSSKSGGDDHHTSTNDTVRDTSPLLKARQRAVSAAERRRAQERADRQLVIDHAAKVLDIGDSSSSSGGGETIPGANANTNGNATICKKEAAVPPAEFRALAVAFATYMTDALGTDPNDLKKRLSNAPATYDDVAQVILLGLPLSLFSRYFAAHGPTFIRGGVQAVPQPNSVVFAKTGISKSTVLRYLLGKELVEDPTATTAANGKDSTTATTATTTTTVPVPSIALDTSFEACVAPERAVTLGDNPHTTDYELTVFRDVRFISVEKTSQRQERHRRIYRRLDRTRALEAAGKQPLLPSGSPAPTAAQLESSLKKSGPMLDDRLLRNVLFVGGEEDGTAMLLTTLMNRLKVPPLDGSHGHVDDDGGEAAGERPVAPAVFQQCLASAQALAERTAGTGHFARL